jgi:hypothetical protein
MWMYNGGPLLEVPESVQGFVYLITNNETGRKYIGKKNFWTAVTRPPLKGKTKKRHSKKESDWRTYTGSSDSLNADIAKIGLDKFTREILHFCKTKSEMSYVEAKLQFEHDAILSDQYYNDWIACKITRKHAASFQKKTTRKTK